MARVGHHGVEAHPLDYVPLHRSPNASPSSDPDVSEPDASVERLLAGVVPAKRQRDARTMLDLVVGCIYLKDLTLVDLAILEQIFRTSYGTLTAGTYTLRAREGGRA